MHIHELECQHTVELACINDSWHKQRNLAGWSDGVTGLQRSPPTSPAPNVGDYRFLALQPIFDRRGKIFGYEALSRSGWDNRFTGDSDAATKLMVGDWMFHELHELTGGCRTFLNCTREALVRGLLTRLPPSTVLELLETVEPDKEVLVACRKMKALGYQIALDDFQHCEKMESLIALADYVKVDFRLSCQEERREIIRRLKKNAATLVAEKIETNEELEASLEEGFLLFQGYYLERPKVFRKTRTSPQGCEFPSVRSTELIHSHSIRRGR